MPAPFGNQNAVGNAGGRPCKYDLEKEAQDLLAWSKNPDSVNLYQFTDDKEYSARHLHDFCDRSFEFSEAFKKAKERLALHREAKAAKGEMYTKVYELSARVHDWILDDKLEWIADREAERKRSIQPELSPESLVQIAAVMDQIQTTRQKA
jgi:hypothetical protein